MTEEARYQYWLSKLGQDLVLSHSTSIPVLGIPTRFESNDAAVIELVENTFGAWRAIEHTAELISQQRTRVALVVIPGDEGQHTQAPLRYLTPTPSRVILTTPGSVGLADAARCEVVAFVTRALLGAREHFRYGVAEGLTLALLTQLDRQPFHAAALTRAGKAVLLAGPSGVGKSTLAYAALRAKEWSILAEDVVYLQSTPPRVWGLPGYLHLPAAARGHFEELRDAEPVVLANRKEKIAVSVREHHGLPARPAVEHASLAILARHGGPPRLERITQSELLGELLSRAEEGFDRFALTIESAIRPFTRDGGWRLTLGSDPTEALPLLAEIAKSTRA